VDEIAKKVATGLLVLAGGWAGGSLINNASDIAVLKAQLHVIGTDVRDIKCAVTKVGCK
jgi:hypothetical protein